MIDERSHLVRLELLDALVRLSLLLRAIHGFLVIDVRIIHLPEVVAVSLQLRLEDLLILLILLFLQLLEAANSGCVLMLTWTSSNLHLTGGTPIVVFSDWCRLALLYWRRLELL